MTQFFQVLKLCVPVFNCIILFYDDSILSGTKTKEWFKKHNSSFYDDSILSGTKT